MDISNGEGVGIVLFVQGCRLHCHNCFNPETWDFNGGKEWTEEVKNKFLELANRPYIKRISILGGEPLAEENLDDILDLVNRIRLSSPQKSIWLYSGFTWEECQPFTEGGLLEPSNFAPNLQKILKKRYEIISKCDVFVDGKYIDSQRDISYPFAGSRNQRVINVVKSIQNKEVTLY